MNKIKKFTVWLIVFALMLTNYGLIFATEAETAEVQQELTEMSDDCACFDFGTMETRKISKYLFAAKETPDQIERDGRKAIAFNTSGRVLTELYVDVEDTYVYAPEGAEVRVQVDYFDEGKGYFTLQYGSVTGDFANAADFVELADTKKWKTHEFYLPDAVFTGRTGGYDIRLSQWSLNRGTSLESVIFGEMRIEKLEQKLLTPVIESDYKGNIFDESEAKELRLKMVNNYGTKVNASVNIKITDHKGALVDEINDKCEFEGNFEYKFVPDVTKYDTYTAEVTINASDNEGRLFEKTVQKKFSVSDKFYPDEKKNPYFGYSTHPDMHHTTAQIRNGIAEIMAQTGASEGRWDLTWESVEKEKGKYAIPEYADILESLDKNGIGSIVILDSPAYNDIHYDQPTSLYPPVEQSALDAYADYVVSVLEMAKGKIKKVEIWNEYNAFPVPAEEYANMLKTVYPRIKAVAPEVEVIGGVTSHVPHDWIKRVFEAGGYNYIDAWSIHPYDVFDNKIFNISSYREKLSVTKQIMGQYGEMKPLYLTEVGWANAEDSPYYVPEEECAAYGVEAFVLMRGENLAELMINYDLYDDFPFLNGHNSRFGSVRYPAGGSDPWSAKLPYIAYSAMNKFIGDAEPVDNIVYEDKNSGVYRFKRNSDGKQIISAFSNGAAKTVSLNLGADSADMYDMYGNLIGTMQSENGVYTIGLSNIPIWLSGDFTKLEEAEGNISINANEFAVAAGEYAEFEIKDLSGGDISLKISDTELEVISNENGKVQLKTNSGEINDYTFVAEAYKGDVLCYRGKGVVETEPPIEVKTELADINEKNCRLLVKISNKSKYNSVSGEVLVKAPDEAASFGGRAAFSNIEPQAEKVCEIRLPEMKKRRALAMETTVSLSDGYTFNESKNYGFSSIARAKAVPCADGVLGKNEWGGIWFTADTEKEMCEIPEWGGGKDLSFRGNLMWDERNLYMCIDVTDEVFDQTYDLFEIWHADSVQVAFNKPGTAEICEFGLTKTPKGVQLYRFNTNYGYVAGLEEAGQKKVASYNGRTVYELSLPWKALFGEDYKPEAGMTVNFSVLVNDCDGDGSRGWAEYASGIGYKKDRTQFVEMKLE